MNDLGNRAPSAARLWLRNNVLGLLAIFIALSGTSVAAQVASDPGGAEKAAKKQKKKKKKKKANRSPRGPAGGALAGSYPNPALRVSGGPCPNGRTLTDVSASAALTCAPGVYSDADGNVAAAPPNPFGALTSGDDNTALGGNALAANASGSLNVAVGFNAMPASNSGTNTAVGAEALLDNTGGLSNTAIGGEALRDNTTGGGNTAIGFSAGRNLTTGSSNIAIRNSGVAGDSNTTRIGSVQTRAFIAGIRGATTGNADAINVLIDSAGQLGTVNSSRRVKHDIGSLGKLPQLMKLKPVSFRYREGPQKLQYGLLAEQVAKVLPELAVYGDDGLPQTVQYQHLPVLLLATIQQQQRQIKRLTRQVRGR